MGYIDKENQKFFLRCYQKALSILRKAHLKEFRKILSGLLKGGYENGKI